MKLSSLKPMVAIWMVTYNHEHYIQQAVESVMMQQTTFDFQLIIGEDCSSDNTRIICQELKEKYPDRISLVLNDSNYGGNKNAMNIYQLCYQSEAKYMAMLEGDDFWTDPLKLQKQVSFLEENPDFEVCFNNIKIINPKGETVKDKLISDNRKTEYVHKDLPIWAPTLTRVFRNRDFSNLPDAPGMDSLILLYQSKFGKIKFMNEVTGVYRMHYGGIYSSQSDAKRKEHIFLTDLASLPYIDTSLNSKYLGMLFKKLIEIKNQELNLYHINKKRLIEQQNSLSKQLTLPLKLKTRIAFLIVSLPLIHRNKIIQKFLIKLMNHLFIYKDA